uniref:acetyl-CoA carboxylase carboxyltransferase beta subunit n=1 Tax=Triosteum sinuatum TaxID=134527 RepID=UPI002238C3FB|nr:acetyl-CoA carboxylase carboxyltransferase beta subunit [Triosteum sinuatum]UYL25497.1 acetyl-CoA carboxylase carboxyltransferase beta subunit [Triosteum sinuatum]
MKLEHKCGISQSMGIAGLVQNNCERYLNGGNISKDSVNYKTDCVSENKICKGNDDCPSLNRGYSIQSFDGSDLCCFVCFPSVNSSQVGGFGIRTSTNGSGFAFRPDYDDDDEEEFDFIEPDPYPEEDFLKEQEEIVKERKAFLKEQEEFFKELEEQFLKEDRERFLKEKEEEFLRKQEEKLVREQEEEFVRKQEDFLKEQEEKFFKERKERFLKEQEEFFKEQEEKFLNERKERFLKEHGIDLEEDFDFIEPNPYPEPKEEDFVEEDFDEKDSDEEDSTQTESLPNPRKNYTHKYKHLWVLCEDCYTLNYKKFLKEKLYICEGCGSHLKMNSSERITLLIDPDTWDPMNEKMASLDPIEFHSEEDPYIDRINSYQKKTGLTEAIQTGLGQLNGIPIAMGVMEFGFMGGSMGSVVGEKITRLIEYATNQSLPLIIVCASGGARMQEGSLSLMQMAKISSALYDFQTNQKLFYVSILTSPTTGGVTASFGMLGDIVIAEPDAYIAFAGKRVIELTLNKEVPEGSQETEYLFEKGLFDLVVPRNTLKRVLNELFQVHGFFPLNQNPLE